MSGVDYCFACWPGGPVTPPPCLRCGSVRGYFATGLCERCHPYADPGVDSCLDCLAWGARRTHGWLCRACVTWRAVYANPAKNGSHGPCRSCGRVLTLGRRGVCRLCHKHASLTREPNEPLDVIGANRPGQQLFFADLIKKPVDGPVTPRVQPDFPAPAAPATATGSLGCPERRDEQLILFTMTPNLAAHGRSGLRQLAHPDDVAPLIAVAHQVADANKWSPRQRKEAIIGVRIMLGIQVDGRGPVRASEVEALRDIDMCVWTVIEVLSTAGALIEDRMPTIDAWFGEHIAELPDPMTEELRIWFDIMKNGTRIPPRRRPRSSRSITLHLTWSLPMLQQWAAAGHTSLREITREHVLDAVPAIGPERVRAIQGLRSIFRLLKQRKVIFVDPTTRIKVGDIPANQPLPLDPERIAHVRDLLNADSPATALTVALIAFHGIRLGQLQRLKLTDIVDGRINVDGRTFPLAAPVRERLATWLDHRAERWPETTNDYLFANKRSVYRGCPVGTRWFRLAIGSGLTPRQLREDRILSEAHANGGDVRAIADLFGLSINASSRYAYTLEPEDLAASSRTRDTT
jgi:integrase